MEFYIVNNFNYRFLVAKLDDLLDDRLYDFPHLLYILPEGINVGLLELNTDESIDSAYSYYELHLEETEEDRHLGRIAHSWQCYMDGGGVAMTTKCLPNLIPYVILTILLCYNLNYFPENIYQWLRPILYWIDVERWIKRYQPSIENATRLREDYQRAVEIVSTMEPQTLQPPHITFYIDQSSIVYYVDIKNIRYSYNGGKIYIPL